MSLFNICFCLSSVTSPQNHQKSVTCTVTKTSLRISAVLSLCFHPPLALPLTKKYFKTHFLSVSSILLRCQPNHRRVNPQVRAEEEQSKPKPDGTYLEPASAPSTIRSTSNVSGQQPNAFSFLRCC